MRAAIGMALAALALSLGGCSGMPSFSTQQSSPTAGGAHPTPGYCYAQGQMYDVNAQACIPIPPSSSDESQVTPTPVTQGAPTPVGAGPPPAAQMPPAAPTALPPSQPQPPAQQ